MQKQRAFHPAVFYPLFFASGAAGLVYQSLWLRMFTLVLGNNLYSAVVVLASFMFGLAAGAWFFGRLVRGRRDTLLIYALLELGLALAGLAAGALIPRIGPLAAFALSSLPPSPGLESLVRFGLSFAVLLVPTALIGGTLPVLDQYVTPQLALSGRRIGALYGWNTVGAVAGCVLTGFWLLRLAGTRSTLHFAAGVNLAVFALALGLSLWFGPAGPPAEVGKPRQSPPVVPDPARRALLVAAFLTGAVVLACEPAWARFLSYILYNDMYVYYLMLGVILAGIGLGSLVYSLWLERRLTSLSALAWLEVGLGLAVVAGYLLSAWHYGRPQSGLWIKHVQGLFDQPFLGLVAVRLAYSAATMLPAAIISGVIFPLTCRLYYRETGAVGQDTGAVLALNTLGGVAGVGFCGLFLIPRLGVQASLFLAASLAQGLGLWLFLRGSGGLRRIPRGKLLLSCAAAALFLVLTLTPSNLVRNFVLKERAQQELLFYREGLSGTVAVTRDPLNGLKNMFINAIPEVQNSFGGMQTFKLMGHLPFILHTGPVRSALMVTYGAGIAAGAMSAHPLRELHVVELEPAVLEASQFFAPENHKVMQDPRVQIHVQDGRNFLYNTRQSFDIIVSDATNPGSADSWVLYTEEFYRLCRSRLDPGGVMAQWLPVHTGTPESYCTILAAFQAVSPHTSIWFTKDYTLLVGLPARLEISWPGLKRALADPTLAADLGPWCLDNPFELVQCFLMGEDAVARMTRDTRPNTDDRPFYQLTSGEQSGPAGIMTLLDRFRERENVILRSVDSLEAPVLSDSLEARYRAEHYLLVHDYPSAGRLLPGNCSITHYMAEFEAEPDYLVAVADSNPRSYYANLRSAVALSGHGRYDQALRLFRRLARLDPGDISLQVNIGNLLLELGKADSAAVAYRGALASGRRDPGLLGKLGRALLVSGQAAQALPLLTEAVEKDSSDADALFYLGYALNRSGEPEKAIACYEKLLMVDPNMPNACVNLGYLYLGRLRNAEAELVFRRALDLDRGSYQAWYGFGVACARQGDKATAVEAFREALSLRPGDTEIQSFLDQLNRQVPAK